MVSLVVVRPRDSHFCETKNYRVWLQRGSLLKKSIKIVLGKKFEQHTTKFVIHSKNKHEILWLEFGDYSGNNIFLLSKKIWVFMLSNQRVGNLGKINDSR